MSKIRSIPIILYKPNPDLVQSPSKHTTNDGQVFWMWRDAYGRDFVQLGDTLTWKYHSTQKPQESMESDVPF